MTTFDEDNGSQYGDYQDDERQGDGLIRIQWRQGDVKQNTPGYFFLSSASVPEGFAPSGDVWKAHQEYFELTRTRDSGWKAETLPMAIICARSQPYRRPTAGSPNKEWLEVWPRGEEGIAQHADVLLVAEGLQDLGPVCWATNSTTVAFAITTAADPKRQPLGGILHRIREEVLDAADKAAKIAYRKKKKLYWLFWITVASQRDAKGNVVFTPTSGKDVTLPVPVLPVVIDKKWLTENFVGSEMAQYGEEQRAAYDAWRLTKQTNEATPAKPANGRNIPQPIEEGAPDF